LKVKDDGANLREERAALLRASEAAVKRLTEIDDTSIIHPQLMERVKLPYEQRLERLAEQTREDPECRLTEGEGTAFRRLRAEALAAERKAVVDMRNKGQISEEVLHAVQQALDLEALQPDR
jgi:CPA1 family monovalent cation:H+ antiporter